MKKLPKRINVAWEPIDNEQPYLIAQETQLGLVDVGDIREVGIYELVETVTLVGKAEVTRRKKPSRA